MRDSTRLATFTGALHGCAFVALAMVPTLVHAQAIGSSAAMASTGAKVARPGYAQRSPVTISKVPASFSIEGLVLDSKTGKAVSGAAGKVTLPKRTAAASDGDFNNPGNMANLPTIDGVDSLATFTGELRRIQPNALGSTERLVAWQWYWVNGHLTASDALAKIHGAIGRLIGQGDDAAVIIVYTPKQPEAASVLQSFLDANGAAIVTTLQQTQGKH